MHAGHSGKQEKLFRNRLNGHVDQTDAAFGKAKAKDSHEEDQGYRSRAPGSFQCQPLVDKKPATSMSSVAVCSGTSARWTMLLAGEGMASILPSPYISFRAL